MWLIETSTFRLHEFTRSAPPYAALSHVTEENEVPLEIREHDRREICNQSRKTVERACGQARTAGISWLWNYAMCVDNRSWASQSEAINSLAHIYRGCEFTIIYLADLVLEMTRGEKLGDILAECRWFKNIWAIPQLIFSRAAYFFSSNWNQIGTKVSMLPLVSSIIGIDRHALEDSECLEDYSIARRMSWASEMTAPRIEDFAYALLGIFNISMPIIYGEGQKAFLKLQEEILKDTNDLSLLAWDSPGNQEYIGVFAPSPACFRRFRNCITTISRPNRELPSGMVPPEFPNRVAHPELPKGVVPLEAPELHNREVYIHCAGITIETIFWRSEDGLFLPLEIEDGVVCPVPLLPWDGCFVRKGSPIEWKPSGPKSAEVVRICLRRHVSAHVSRKISTHERNLSKEPYLCLDPIDDTSTMRKSGHSNVDSNHIEGTCNKAPAVARGPHMAVQHSSSMSSTVPSPNETIPDFGANGCLKPQYKHLYPAERCPGRVAEQLNQPTVPGISPTYVVSCAVPSDTVTPIMGDRHYKTDNNHRLVTKSSFDNDARPSCAHKAVVEAPHISGDCLTGDLKKSAVESPFSRLTGQAAINSPQITTSESGSPPGEVQVLDVTSITKELAGITAEKFLSRRQEPTRKRSLIPWGIQSRKRVKRAESSDQLEGVYTSDSDDGETVLIKKARYFACPFYVRNNQYTECLKRHHFESIEDVKEHICWDHRRPKFCPICKKEFSSGADRDEHIRLRACDASTANTPDGITDDQEERLERENEPSLSEETQWFRIWETIFPQVARPASAFYTSQRDVSICAFRKFWQQSGEETVANFLEASNCRSYNLRNEERDLRTIYELVMERVVNRIFDDFGDLISKH
ncbi:hypothetical protein KVR01_007103 [Diaporthe batatas]|uniref:uncharacterized protein n=1 Tax=Diaporthe batatas TaxID=748121 RepID=UPI001D053B5A|nr:uncharacterized protein KVR01_007103 [Diaporthe batatas]KAG8162625.1 hypothetical protein KVR01_007103 [Diaporthe batatas]